VAVSATTSAQAIARMIDDVERRVRAEVPVARVIYIEPDIARALGTQSIDPDTSPGQA
ncbi:MAG: cation transporter, partial [Nakamurella sp.]